MAALPGVGCTHPRRRQTSAITLWGCSVRWSADRPRPRVGPLAILGAAFLLVGAMLARQPGDVRAAADLGGPLPGLSPEELSRFEAGAAIFSKVHGPEDGLGPVFNGRACAECHALPVPGGA